MEDRGQTGARIVKNSLFLVGSRFFELAVAFVLPLYIARSLGPTPLGAYALVTSLLTIFATFAYFGQDSLLPREVTRHRDQATRYLLNASLIGLVMAALFSLAMAITGRILGYDPMLISALLVAALALFPDTLSTIGESVLVGLERMDYIAIIRAVVNTLRVAASIVVLRLGYGLWVVFGTYGLAQMALTLAYWVFLSHYQPMAESRIDTLLCKRIVKNSSIFLGISLFGVTFRNADVILLEKMKNLGEVGIYSAPDRLMRVISATAPAFFLSIFPVLSSVFANSREKFHLFSTMAIKFVSLGILGIALTVIAFADRIVIFVYGKGFIASILVLQLLIGEQVFNLISTTMFWIMVAGNLERASLRIDAIKAIVNLAINLALIPFFGAVGAAVAAVATQVTAVMMRCIDVNKRLFKLDLTSTIIKPFLCAAIAILPFYFLRGLGPYLILPCALLLYATAIFLTRTVSRQEWALLKGVCQNLSTKASTILKRYGLHPG